MSMPKKSDDRQHSAIVATKCNIKDTRIRLGQLQAGLTIGDWCQNRIGQIVAHLCECEREDRKVDSRPTQRDETDGDSKNPANHSRDNHASIGFMLNSLKVQTAA